ncbi:MAG: hypothetical protein ABIQ16_22585, partial [Polyangiaceae bacterium]
MQADDAPKQNGAEVQVAPLPMEQLGPTKSFAGMGVPSVYPSSLPLGLWLIPLEASVVLNCPTLTPVKRPAVSRDTTRGKFWTRA